VSPSYDSKQTWIGLCPIFGVVYDQLHLAADALESCSHLEFQKIAGVARRSRGRKRLIYRLCLEQVVKPMPTDSDLDISRSDIDTGLCGDRACR
jgi:hypothetical protein